MNDTDICTPNTGQGIMICVMTNCMRSRNTDMCNDCVRSRNNDMCNDCVRSRNNDMCND
mgnify:CR=1 FL=1